MDLELNEAQVSYAQAILECGIIELEPLQEWLATLQEVPGDLGEALIAAKLVKEFELTSLLGRRLGLSIANEIELEMDAAPHPKIPRDVCVELLCIPLSDQELTPFPIAFSNPFDEVGIQYVSELLDGVDLKLSLATPSHIRAEITACYGTEKEWLQYIQEQTHNEPQEPKEGLSHSLHNVATQGSFIEPPSSDIPTSAVDQNGRPASIPDWSHLCPDGPQKLAALDALFKEG